LHHLMALDPMPSTSASGKPPLKKKPQRQAAGEGGGGPRGSVSSNHSAGGTQRRLSVEEIKEVLADPATARRDGARRGSIGSTHGEMVLPSPVPEHARRDAPGSRVAQSAEVAAANARLQARRNSAQAMPEDMPPQPSRGRASRPLPTLAPAAQLRPNAFHVRLGRDQYQMEAQQSGLQLYDGSRLVRQYTWADIKSWQEEVDNSVRVTTMDDVETVLEMRNTGPICQAMQDHTKMLRATKQREREDHDRAVARATRAEEAEAALKAELQGAQDAASRAQAAEEAQRAELEAAREDVARATSELASERRARSAEEQSASGTAATERRARQAAEERAQAADAELATERRARLGAEERAETAERRSAELQRERAAAAQELAAAAEGKRAAERRCDDLARSARETAAASEAERDGALRQAQEQAADSEAQVARLRRELEEETQRTASAKSESAAAADAANARAEKAVAGHREAVRAAEAEKKRWQAQIADAEASGAAKAESEVARLMAQEDSRYTRMRADCETQLCPPDLLVVHSLPMCLQMRRS